MKSRTRKPAKAGVLSRAEKARGCWSVVLIDGEPIRKKARRDYDKVLRDIEKAKTDVERFEAVDTPQFNKWLHSTFGALITEARELNQKLMQTRALVSEVQQEHFFGGHRSIVEAYRAVMQRMAEEQKAEESMRPEEEETGPESKDEEGYEDSEEAFREFASSIGFDLGEEDDFPGESERPAQAAKLKDLYRAVVRRLHPDKMKSLTPKEVEWWHQAQTAYQAGEVEQLELILTLCEVEDRGTKETSVSVLGQLVSHFKSSLRALKRRLTQYKRDPAWNFSNLKDYSGLHQRAENLFHEQITLFRVELTQYETLLEKWKMQAESGISRRPRTVGRRARREEEEFLF